MPESKTSFAKPPTTYREQIALLQSRGMSFDGVDNAERCLEHMNYYRLGAYWLPDEIDHAQHQFKSGTMFADVLTRYHFDRSLRLLFLDAIECVEVSIRSKWAYEMAHRHGPHAHLNPSLAQQFDRWVKDSARMLNEAERSNEMFIQHHRLKYAEGAPPIWAACEVMSLGLLSRFYDNLKDTRARRAISSPYEISHEVLASWLRHLSVVRNICAHHARLWNREFVVTLQVPKSKRNRLNESFVIESRHIYNTVVALLHLMSMIRKDGEWDAKLCALFRNHDTYLASMGFPSDWQSRAIWKRLLR